MRFLHVNLKSFLLSSILIFLVSVTTVFGNAESTGKNKEERVIAHKQYTYVTRDSMAVNQTQSVRVNPEIRLISRDDAMYMDTIVSKYVDRIEAYLVCKNEETRERSQGEAKAYLFAFLATLILSGMGLFVGSRTENSSITYLSILLLGVTVTFILLKIPTLILLF